MAESTSGSTHPGLSVGPTSEFSLFFHVKPGEGPSLRRALLDLQNTPGYRDGDYNVAIQTIHEARFVLFDDDTRLAFVTSFDGPWEAYMEDFFTSGPTLGLFDVIFRHVDGYDGLPDLAAVRSFVLGAEEPAAAYARNYPARSRRSGRPSASTRPSSRFSTILRPPSCSSTRRCSRCSTKPATSRATRSHARPMSDHISGPRALADPIADITDVYAFPSPERADRLVLVVNTLPMARPSDRFSEGLVYRFRVRPLDAPTEQDLGGASSPPRTSTSSTASSPLRIRPLTVRRRRAPAPPPRASRSRSASTTRRAVPAPACASSPAPGGTRSSWTHGLP